MRQSPSAASRTAIDEHADQAQNSHLLKDHLGPLDVITRSNGTQMARASSDAWGRRRNGGSWTGNPAASEWTAITDTTRHGFTSREMLDNLNLTHMNGRVYDQVLGRFLSPDPFIDGVGSTQGWNRYSYVHNNPLSWIDPSGFDAEEPGKKHCNDDCDDTRSGGGLLWEFATRGNAYTGIVFNSSDYPSLREALLAFRYYNPGTTELIRQYGHEVGSREHWGYVNGSGTPRSPFSTAGGFPFGASNVGRATRPFTLEEPQQLLALRRAHPQLDRALEQLWADSFRGQRHEEGLLVYQSRATGRLLFNTTALVPDGDSELTWADPSKPYFPHYRGYSLVLTAHTHPFQVAFGSSAVQCFFVTCKARGPSSKDIATSIAYPSAFHMIIGVGYGPSRREFIYYGDRANIDE